MIQLIFKRNGEPVHTTDADHVHTLTLSDLTGQPGGSDDEGTDVLDLDETAALNVTVDLNGLTLPAGKARPIIDAAQRITDVHARETFWAWTANLGRNVTAYHDATDVHAAFKRAYVTTALSREQYLREALSEAGTDLPRALTKFIDWEAYAESERDEIFVDLKDGHVGIFNPN